MSDRESIVYWVVIGVMFTSMVVADCVGGMP
jgi:hypothetical protein